MRFLDSTSLANTIENVSEALFFGFEIAENEKQAIAVFLVSRHHAQGAYGNMFAPTNKDLKRDFLLFTGEKIRSNAGRRHMMGEEASRTLHKLGLKNESIETTLRESDEGIASLMKKHDSRLGTYCCKTCSCSLWLNVSAGGLNGDTCILKTGMDFLKQHREEKGTWKGFPYYYTLYVLNEVGTGFAIDEMRFAEQSIKRWIKRKPDAEDKIALRRFALGERILGQI
ncbi:MAG: hypothetical protein JW735_01545 [Prolixibacteraceae bacterium]|nr:hypothetical protein [Prolixibacteraceae bacterium]